MANQHPLVEEGDGAPSFRPLFMLLPYLWPKERPDLRLRVLVSIVLPAAGQSWRRRFAAVSGLGHRSSFWPVRRQRIALGIALSLIAAYVLVAHPDAGLRPVARRHIRQGALSRLARSGVSTFAHVHTLSLRFHLERKTGGLSRVIERGTKGIDTLLSFALFSIFPTLLQLLFFSVDHDAEARNLDRADHLADGGGLYLVHLCDHALAHPVSAAR